MNRLFEAELKSLEDRLVDPAEFFKQRFYGREVFRFILTHPDMDHMSGLYRLFSSEQESISLINFWDTEHSKTMSEVDFTRPGAKGTWQDWQEYLRIRSSMTSAKVLYNYRDDSRQYWDEDRITILSPTTQLAEDANSRQEWNRLSYVLMVEYCGRRIVLGGDADVGAWADIYARYADDGLKVDLLKASHHGRDSGYYQPAVKAMDPKFTVVSVGKKPDSDASNKYRHYSQKVLSTRFHGTIHAQLSAHGEIVIYDCDGMRSDDNIAPAL